MIGIQHTTHEETSPSSYSGAFSYWKAGILATFTVGCGFAASYLMNSSLTATGFTRTHMLAWGSVSLIFFLIFTVLDVIFINRKWAVATVMALAGISLGVGLINSFSQNSFIASVVATILIVSSGLAARTFFDSSLKVQFFRISNTALKGAILAVAVIAGFVFFDVFSLKPIGGENPILPQSFFEKSADLISKFISPATGGIDFSKSLKEVAAQALDSQIAQTPGGANLSQSQKDQLVSSVVDEYKAKLSGILGADINPDKKLSSVLYEALLNKVNNLPGPTRTTVMIVGAVIILLTITTVSPIIRPIIAAIAFLFFELLLAINFGVIVNETRSKETIVLP
jgi:hypothetical protein